MGAHLTFDLEMIRVVKTVLRYGFVFVGALFLTTVLNVFAWNMFIDGVVYYHSPWYSVSLGYLLAPDWISEDAVVVSSIDHDATFKEPQQVLQGWSDKMLLCIWFVMLACSLGMSVMLARWLGRVRDKQAESDPRE